MPFLKFRCEKCEKVFDELVSLAKIDEVKCPVCGGKVERAYEGKCQNPNCSGGCSGSCSSCAGGCHH